MDVSFVNPFIESIVNVLSTMALVTPERGKPYLKKDNKGRGEVSGLMGLAGSKTRGSLAITFTGPAIIQITEAMLGEKIEEVNDTVSDMVGEITNMVSGGAKKILAERGYKFEMAIPSTIMGKDHKIIHKTSGPIVVIPFKIQSGKFFVEVCFE